MMLMAWGFKGIAFMVPLYRGTSPLTKPPRTTNFQNNIKKSHLDTVPSFVTTTTILSTSPTPLFPPLRGKEQTVMMNYLR